MANTPYDAKFIEQCSCSHDNNNAFIKTKFCLILVERHEKYLTFSIKRRSKHYKGVFYPNTIRVNSDFLTASLQLLFVWPKKL